MKEVTYLGADHVVACAIVVAVACFVNATYWEHIWWSIATGIALILFYIVTKIFETAILRDIIIYIDAGNPITAPTAA